MLGSTEALVQRQLGTQVVEKIHSGSGKGEEWAAETEVCGTALGSHGCAGKWRARPHVQSHEVGAQTWVQRH